MTKKINIMYIIDHFHGSGGTETHLTYLVENLSREKFNPCIVIFDMRENHLIDRIRKARIPVYYIPVQRYYTLNALQKAFSLAKLIQEKQVDIVQTFHFKSDFYGAIIARFVGVRKIISSKRDIGDNKKELHFFLNRIVRKLFTGVIVVADAVGDVVRNKEKIPPDKIKTIYNGVNYEAFTPAGPETKSHSKVKLGLNPSDFVIGTVAWFRPEKNYDVFFEAFSIAYKEIGPSLKAIVVGGGPLFEYFKETVKSKEYKDNVIFTGPVNNPKKYLRALDVACLVPGANEGFSNSILEKMAMGLPLIVTDVGGNREAVQDDFNGKVISPNDAISLVKAITDFYYNPEKRKIMGKRSRTLVKEQFTLEKMLERHETYYLQQISS